MVWLLTLHICSLLIWAAALLILFPLIHHTQLQLADNVGDGEDIDRLWYTRLASPAALLSIISGTAVFLLGRIVDNWLLVKLTLVTLLVMCHVIAGLLILYHKRQPGAALALKCQLLFGTTLVLLLGIIATVLLKPSEELLLWLF